MEGKLKQIKNRLSLLPKIYFHDLVTTEGTGVLFVIRCMSLGGAEKVALDIMTGLSQRGHRVYCISTVASENEWEELFKKTCVEVVDLSNAREQNKAWFIQNFAEARGIDRIITTNNLQGYQAAERIKKHGSNIKIFDILHGQGGQHEGGGWPLLSMPYDKFLDRRIVITKYLKKYMVKKHGVASHRIFVIHNGIELNKPATNSQPLEIKKFSGNFIVLWAGRFSLEKHPELAVEIARIVCEKNPKVRFLMAGGGEMKPELEQQVADYGLEDCFIITKKPFKDPSPYMANSNLLLMTSEMEGLPLVALEAFTNKTPVIAPAVGGLPEIIDDEKMATW